MKHDLALLPVGQFERDLHGRARIESRRRPCPTAARASCAAGSASVPLRPRNSVRSPVTVRCVSLHVEERDARRGTRCCRGCARTARRSRRPPPSRRASRSCARGSPSTHSTKPVTDSRAAGRSVAELQPAELHRGVGGDVGPHLGGDAVLGRTRTRCSRTRARLVYGIGPRAGSGVGDQNWPVSSSRM